MRFVPTCAACASTLLVPHMRVGGSAGAEGLIPATVLYGTALADVVRCPACGHAQLERLPDAVELAEAYAEAESVDYVDEEAGQRARPRRGTAPARRSGLHGPPQRGQPDRAAHGPALVVGDTAPRPPLHAPQPLHAAPPPRLRAAVGGHRAKGVHRSLLPPAGQRVLAARRRHARRRRGRAGRRGPYLGARSARS